MLRFLSENSASILPSVGFTIVIIICCLISLALNPVIFLFNRRKNSVAAFLFTILSSIDFLYCFTLPFVLFLEANEILEEGRWCFGLTEDEYWNCVFSASTGHKVSTAVMHCLESATVSTTGLLAITRYIQLKNPFFIVKKKIITLSITLVFIVILCLQLFRLFSPLNKTRYSPMLMLALNVNPYDIGYSWPSQYLSEMINNSGTISVQIAALISTILTAYILFRKSSNNTLGSNSRKRKRGSLKILLTNFSSFLTIVRLMVESPIWALARQGKPGLYSELQGWIIFSLHRMLPLLASTWNPVIFISMTPKSRELIRRIFRGPESLNTSNNQRATIVISDISRDQAGVSSTGKASLDETIGQTSPT